mgnify:FL=1|tara:strand:+ start:39 stop:353 length:315 start_codon:yes stop_codon:yes gene_type:complete
MAQYKYVYADYAQGYLHLEEEHVGQGHDSEDCYQLKDRELWEVEDLNAEEVNAWQQLLKFKMDLGEIEVIDYIQLDKDFNAWLTKRQLGEISEKEIYGEDPNEL